MNWSEIHKDPQTSGLLTLIIMSIINKISSRQADFLQCVPSDKDRSVALWHTACTPFISLMQTGKNGSKCIPELTATRERHKHILHLTFQCLCSSSLTQDWLLLPLSLYCWWWVSGGCLLLGAVRLHSHTYHSPSRHQYSHDPLLHPATQVSPG